MRETVRDFLIAVGAGAALFAAVVSWSNGREIAAVREDLATVQDTLRTTSDTVIAHVNAPGLHGPIVTTTQQ